MLEVELCGMKLKNPLILASGILGSSAATLSRMAEHCGAVVTKSVGIEGREGYPNPTVLNWRCGLLNAVGLASPPAAKFAEELRKYRGDARLVVSLYGSSPSEFAKLVEIFDFADAFEINLSCPHVKKAGLEIGNDIELSKSIVRAAKDATEKPVFAKISAMHRYVELGCELERVGVDAITITNSLPGMRIDVISRRPVLSNVTGGVSGIAIKPIAVKCVYDLYRHVDVPLIGCGGVTTFEDVLEFLMAGATCVEVGSANFFSTRIIYSLKESLVAFLRAEGCSVREIIGAAHTSIG
ncbi:MAG: dihydroorotate dehydrogenase [Archaeoglobaceae archaeon]